MYVCMLTIATSLVPSLEVGEVHRAQMYGPGRAGEVQFAYFPGVYFQGCSIGTI